jgi:hypothetical protein
VSQLLSSNQTGVMADHLEKAQDLVTDLYATGTLSEASTSALLNAKDTVREIGVSLGETVGAREVLLATLLVDDSASVASNLVDIQRGHALMLRALAREASETSVLVHTRLLNRGLVQPFTPIRRASALDRVNYNSARLFPWTPLYRQSLLTLAATVAKAHELERSRTSVRTFTLILTDGEDNPSGDEPGTVSEAAVRVLAKDMLEFATNHIVAAMGVGERVDYRAIFRSMGIPDAWILTPGSTDEELDAVFRRISRALQLAASSEGAFLELTAGPPGSD